MAVTNVYTFQKLPPSQTDYDLGFYSLNSNRCVHSLSWEMA